MNRFLFTLFVALAAGKAECSNPNILFIAVDDLRVELGCYGQKHIHSPNIDRLARSGVRFDRAYCQVPVCGASRSSLLSGVRPTRNLFAEWFSEVRHELPDALTLPAHFKANGYQTICRGKVFHSNFDALDAWTEPPWPAKGGNVSRFLDPDSLALVGRHRGTPWAERGPAFEGKNLDVPDNAYPTGELTDRVVADIANLAKGDQPFFLAVGFWKPHLPFNAPKKYWDQYDPEKIQVAANPFRPEYSPNAAVPVWNETEKELRFYSNVPHTGPLPDQLARDLRHAYYACVSYTDAQIGRILDTFDEFGLTDNTIVILWSDHGWQLGEHGLWGKKLLFDESLRVPLIVSAPGIPTGQTASGIVELLDIYPTLCDLAGLPIPDHLDGRSFVPLLRDPSQAGRTWAHSRMYEGDVVTTERYRYVEWTNYRRAHVLNKGKVFARVLFDRADDAKENKNIAEAPEYQELIQAFHERLSGKTGN